MVDKTLFPTDAEFTVVPEVTEGERQHYGRSHWPPGPWHQEEFDRVSWVDPETGLDCQLYRGPMGSWCGYVGVAETHPWHGGTYSGCLNKHPPLTLEARRAKAQKWHEEAKAADLGSTLHRSTEIAELNLKSLEGDGWMSKVERWDCECPTPEGVIKVHGGLTYSGDSAFLDTSRLEDLWWFGFDTAHAWDLSPGMLASSALMHGRAPELFTDHLTYDPTDGTNEGGESYKTVRYCKREVESLARQLRDIHLAAVGQPV